MGKYEHSTTGIHRRRHLSRVVPPPPGGNDRKKSRCSPPAIVFERRFRRDVYFRPPFRHTCRRVRGIEIHATVVDAGVDAGSDFLSSKTKRASAPTAFQVSGKTDLTPFYVRVGLGLTLSQIDTCPCSHSPRLFSIPQRARPPASVTTIR